MGPILNFLTEQIMDANIADAKFWPKVLKTDSCWLWQAGGTAKGYGQMRVDGKAIYAHRFSYELHKGPIDTGKVIMHSCDTPACVNPAHLTAGTYAENIQDAVRKGRWSQSANLKKFRPKREVARREAGLGLRRYQARPNYGIECIHGHAYTPENTYYYKGKKRCRVCKKSANATRAKRAKSITLTA